MNEQRPTQVQESSFSDTTKPNSGIKPGKDTDPDAAKFNYERNNSMKSPFFKIQEPTYTYSQVELIIGPWLNFRNI